MAKQSGLHQIRGKVGEYSYYKSTGINSGLIRSINQGLSQRVKTGEEYANTRLNNTEFGAACNVAGLLGRMVQPKFRPMILPYSQSKMSQEILKVARQHTENWGQRVVTSEDTQKLCDILSSTSKRNPFEFILSFDIERTSLTAATLSVEVSANQATLMSSLGINHLTVTAVQYDLATGQWNPLAQEMATGYMFTRDSILPLDSQIIAGQSTDGNEDIIVDEFTPEANHSSHQIVVFVVLPARVVNNINHVLQEYCSFKAMPLPAYVP